MSRSTQFIGLTKDAQEFAKKYLEKTSPFPYDTGFHQGMALHAVAEGMFDEQIPLDLYVPKDPLDPVTEGILFVREVVQMEPWSSGPMIFTQLEIHFRSGPESGFSIYQWVHDPLVKNEYDKERGRAWV